MKSRRLLPLSVLYAAVATNLALVTGGCNPTTPVAGSVPAPRFIGPTVSPRLAPAPSPSQHASSGWQPSAIPGIPNDWLPRAKANSWKYIVIHHSASPTGSVAIFDHEHKSKGWDGVGYHFVIGNGHGMSDGLTEPTPRWPIQKWGAHTKTADNRFNDYGIGICMVGNFDQTQPSAAQLKSVAKLVAFLMKTYNISPANVYGHGQCKPTNCPGKYTSIARIKQLATQQLAASGLTPPTSTDTAIAVTPNTELLTDSH